MTNVKQAVSTFLDDEEGLTVVEYAVAGGLISAVLVAAFTALGARVCTIINFLVTSLGGTAAACTGAP